MLLPCFCCGGSQPPPGYPDFDHQGCFLCETGMSKCWEVAIAGATNDTCSECDDYNGTRILVPDLIIGQSACLFMQHVGGCGVPCGQVDPPAVLPQYIMMGAYHLFVGIDGFTGDCEAAFPQEPPPDDLARWAIVIGDLCDPVGSIAVWAIQRLNCFGENEFGLCYQRDSCANWPTTITATPIGCPA